MSLEQLTSGAIFLISTESPFRNGEVVRKRCIMIAGRLKEEPQPRTTFSQSEVLIRDVARLTDYAPQLAYISGWVYYGQDTGYPSEDVVNESLGDYPRLMALMSTGRGFNANVSVATK